MITTKNYTFTWLKGLTLVLIFFVVGLNASLAWSWTTNPAVNTAISIATNSQNAPQITADGSGGVIITWQDYRNGSGADIYAQRVNAAGTALWTADGVAISTASSEQWDPQIITDGSGGAIITWRDYRSGNWGVYAQRIDASGTVLWTIDGLSIAIGVYPQLTSDGSGGAIITWLGIGGMRVQRVNAAGTVQWATTGVAISNSTGAGPQIISDGTGGAIITWQDLRNGGYGTDDIYAQKINAAGTVMWTVDGVVISTATLVQDYPQITTDGTGGAIITWVDRRNVSRDIYTQRVNTSGTVMWVDDGVVISAAASDQLDVQITTDNSGGAIITWRDYRYGNYDIYAQRVNDSGMAEWMANGVPISIAARNQDQPQITADGIGGAIITWRDLRTGSNTDIYAQRVNSSGTSMWTYNGAAISYGASYQHTPQITDDGTGGAIITWHDTRSGSDIYAQRIYSTGDLFPTYSIGGSVSGLAAGNSVALQNNGSDDLTKNGDGNFTFVTSLADGSAYAVTVLTQPTVPNQTCNVTNGSGTLVGADVTNVSITCVNTYTVGGTVSGLAAGNSVELQNNGGDTLSIGSDGAYTFATTLVDGGSYVVTVSTQPDSPNQTCSVANGSGTIAGADASNVNVTCVTNTYTIGGTVSGLAAGNGVVLQNNGGDALTVNANETFTFATALDDGSSHNVTVQTHPTSPSQTCTVSSGSGALVGANITNVNVTCVTNTYTVGGIVSGLASGNNVLLQNNGGDDLTVSADGSFVFSAALDDESSYVVTVLTPPDTPNQTCTVSNGNGTLAGANISNVNVSCVTNTYTVGGSISGLAAGNNVVLQNNGSDNLTVSANGSFIFATALDDESSYVVTVLTQPTTPNQVCTVSNGTGTLAGANVTDVNISCVTTYTVGGSVSGLAAGNDVTLQNNGGDALIVNTDGSFTFTTALVDGSNYTVSILTQPDTPNQTCTLLNGSGTVGGADVTDVSVTCVTNKYSISVTVTDLVTGDRNSITLQNNAEDDLKINDNGSFTFLTALDDGSGYSVTILTQPKFPKQTCRIYSSIGTLSGENVIDVQVSCKGFPWAMFLPAIQQGIKLK